MSSSPSTFISEYHPVLCYIQLTIQENYAEEKKYFLLLSLKLNENIRNGSCMFVGFFICYFNFKMCK